MYLIFATGNGQRVVEKYDPNNQNHDKQSIYGKAEFTKGLDEMKLYPGVF